MKTEKIYEIKEEEKNINNKLFKEYFIIYQSPSNMYKELHMEEGTRNEDRVYLIKKVLNRMKKVKKMCLKIKKLRLKKTKK